MEPVPDRRDYFLFARRSGDQKEFAFRAGANGPLYYIHVYDEKVGTKKQRLMFEKPVPLEVMTSSEVGAGGALTMTFQGRTKRQAGEFVEHGDMGNLTPPKNWTWGMSIRDRFR